MTNSEWRGGKRDEDKDKVDQSSLHLPAKIGKMTAPPLMTKTHYSFEESFRFIKSKFPNFTHENLLNHGFQGDVSFFVNVPPDVNVQSLFGTSDLRFSRSSPRLLTLHQSSCEDIERNGITHADSFPTGYWYDETYKFIKALPNYITHGNDTPLWRTFKNDEPYGIPISVKSVLVTHFSLIQLAQRIELRLAYDNKPKNQQVILNKFPSRIIPKTCDSLIDLSSKILDCKPVDLLRRAIQRNLTLLAMVPDDVVVRSSDSSDYESCVEYMKRPQFLELNSSDCRDIYINDEVSISDFPAGYIFGNLGRMTQITPSLERSWLPAESTSWRTFRGTTLSDLNLSCEDLYVLQSDVTELRVKDESQKFKIPEDTIKLLLANGFISMERGVEIAKLKYPECTKDHLLRFGSKSKLDITTPIPVGITINKFKNLNKTKIKLDSSDGYPVLLNLNPGACEKIEDHGKSAEGMFSTDYWIYQNKFQRKSVTGEEIWGLATYFKNQPHEIELNLGNLYINKSILLEIAESESNLWASIDEEIIKDAEGQKHGANALDPSNANALAIRKTETLPESPSERITFLDRGEVMKRLGIGRSKMYHCMDRKSPYYDEDFPLPIEDGNRKKRWVESKVKAYQELLMIRCAGPGPVG